MSAAGADLETALGGRCAHRTNIIQHHQLVHIILITPLRLQKENWVALTGTMATARSRPLEYLEGRPGTTFNKLYEQPSTALAIFRRMLPDLGILRSPP